MDGPLVPHRVGVLGRIRADGRRHAPIWFDVFARPVAQLTRHDPARHLDAFALALRGDACDNDAFDDCQCELAALPGTDRVAETYQMPRLLQR